MDAKGTTLTGHKHETDPILVKGTIREGNDPMRLRIRRVVPAFVIAVGLTIALAALSSVERFTYAGAVFAPGMLLAALVFPQGVESGHGDAYLALAGVITALVLTWPIMKLIQVIRTRQ
jgi:peptidoglycan/LPS O-acetylase OafA/YrhL